MKLSDSILHLFTKGMTLSFFPSLFGVKAAGIAIQFSGVLQAFTFTMPVAVVTQLLVSVMVTSIFVSLFGVNMAAIPCAGIFQLGIFYLVHIAG